MGSSFKYSDKDWKRLLKFHVVKAHENLEGVTRQIEDEHGIDRTDIKRMNEFKKFTAASERWRLANKTHDQAMAYSRR